MSEERGARLACVSNKLASYSKFTCQSQSLVNRFIPCCDHYWWLSCDDGWRSDRRPDWPLSQSTGINFMKVLALHGCLVVFPYRDSSLQREVKTTSLSMHLSSNCTSDDCKAMALPPTSIITFELAHVVSFKGAPGSSTGKKQIFIFAFIYALLRS